MLKLQHAQERDHAYRAFAPIEWSEDLRCWCVFDPELIVAILKSPQFPVPDYVGGYAKLDQKRAGQGWNVFADMLWNIPFANEGDRHAALRRDFARLIGTRSPAAKKAVGALLGQLIPLVFRDGARAELIADFVRPLNDTLFAELIGAPLPTPTPDGSSPSQVFDRQLGLNRLMRVRDEIARAAKFFSEASLATSPDYATAFLAVGHDSVLGSLGTSLVAVLREGDGALLCDLDWPPFLPRTGVPYIERMASNDGEIQGFRFTGGDRFRLFLDACPARGHAGEDAAFFGKGRHVCLGKDLSQWLWQSVAQALAKVPLRVEVIEARLRRHDFVFSLYERIEVSIHG